MNDTSPEIARMVRERYMEMSGERRFLIGIQMFDTARTIALSSLPQDLSENEKRQRLCERFYGSQFAEKMFAVKTAK
ncbi:MAG: hypothetical protein JXA04_09610 [Gammaproteobacteria bacterium]|nr:hypothetical protein [Gammaproteobacteria bacterium]